MSDVLDWQHSNMEGFVGRRICRHVRQFRVAVTVCLVFGGIYFLSFYTGCYEACRV